MTDSPLKQKNDFHSFLASLSVEKMGDVESCCDLVEFKAKAKIYSQDAPSDCVYIVERGVVEAETESPDGSQTCSLAYLCRGDIFGELGCLTGQDRIASTRAIEDCVLRKISKKSFLELMLRVPSFGVFIATRLAEMLHRTTSALRFNTYCNDFSGNLQNFDLLLIFQTISSSGETGELRMVNPNNDIFGSFFFRKGRVEFARYAHLEGLEAIWQVFVEPALQGTFVFQAMGQPSLPFSSSFQMNMDGMDLLMQAATKRDHFQSLPPEQQNLSQTVGRAADALQWTEPEYADAAAEFWKILEKRPQPLQTVWRRMAISSATLAHIVNVLLGQGQICVVD